MYTLIFPPCNKNKSLDISEYDNFIMSFDRISLEIKNVPIDREKKTHLANNCVTLKNFVILKKRPE